MKTGSEMIMTNYHTFCFIKNKPINKNMKIRTAFFATAITYLVLVGCNNTANNNNENKTDPAVDKPSDAKPSNFDLLQGKWQSEDDKTNFVVFEKNHRKEIAEGTKAWDDEEFIISDQCGNEMNKADNNPKEKDKYISCIKSDLCWYIESVTAEKLILQYMGRGNTLKYTRVK